MKTLTTLCASLTLIALLSGCASAGYQRAGSMATSLKSAADRVHRGTAQIDTALTSLNELTDLAAADLKPQFNKFSSAANALDTLHRDLGRQTVTLQQQSVAHFQKWDEELAKIQNADIRETSTKRKAEVMRQVDGTLQKAETARAALAPFVAEINDIRTALRADLTRSGLEAIRPSAQRVNRTGATAKEALAGLAIQYEQLSASLSAVTPKPSK